MNDLSKEVLELVGFEVKKPYEYYDYDGNSWDRYVLCRHGYAWGYGDNIWCQSSRDAWAQAPSLVSICEALKEALAINGLRIGLHQVDVGWEAYLQKFHSSAEDNRILNVNIGVYGYGKLTSEAIASLFIAACKAGLIKSDSVKLKS